MEAIEIAEFTTRWKLWWFLPETDECLNDKGLAELGFGLSVEPIRPTRCRACAKSLLLKLENPNQKIGIDALSGLP